MAFLLYDPFSLAIWGVSILGFVLWGRGLFCGWLCPFGAMQEFAHHIARFLRIPQITVSDAWDDRLKWIKYGVLAALIAIMFSAPAALDTAIEVEPFKTAVTDVLQFANGIMLPMLLGCFCCRWSCSRGSVATFVRLVP